MTSETRTMTLNLSAREMAVLNQLAEKQELSKTGVLRQALRLYQLVAERASAGETFYFSGDPAREVVFIGAGLEPTP